MNDPFDPLPSTPFGPSPTSTDEQGRAVRQRRSNTWAGLIPPPPGVATPQFGPPSGDYLDPVPFGPFGQFSLPMGPAVPTVSMQLDPGALEAALSSGRTAARLRAGALENLARNGIPGFDTPGPAPVPQIPLPDVGLLNPVPMAGLASQFKLPMAPSAAGPISSAPNPGEPSRALSGPSSAQALSSLARADDGGAGLTKTATAGKDNCAVTATFDRATGAMNLSFANLEAGIKECGYDAMEGFAADALKAEAAAAGYRINDDVARRLVRPLIAAMRGSPI